MNLDWSAANLAWGADLRRQLAGQADRSDRAALAQIFAAFDLPGSAMPGQGRTITDPGRAMLAMVELGRALVLDPIIEATCLPAQLLAGDARFAPLNSALANGDMRIAVGWLDSAAPDVFAGRSDAVDGKWRLTARKAVVVGAADAAQLLIMVRAGATAQVFLVPAEAAGLSLLAYPMIDDRPAADVILDGTIVEADALVASGPAAERLVDHALQVATAMACAQAVGMMRYLLDATVQFLKGREQFGQRLSDFQVLQHRLVEMLVHVEMSEAATLRAMLSLDLGERERALAVSAGMVTVVEAARFVGRNAIQLHGGQGMSNATPATHYFRRLTAIELLFGNARQHLAVIAGA